MPNHRFPASDLYRALVTASADHVFLLDEAGVFVASNDRVGHLGYQRGEELMGRTLEEVYPAPAAARVRASLARCLTQGTVFTGRAEFPSPNGPKHHMGTFFPVPTPDGRRYCGCICRDVTELRRAEEESQRLLAASEAERQRFAAIFEHTGTATIIVGRDGRILRANQECTAITGFRPEELVGTSWRDHVAEESLAQMEAYFARRFTAPEEVPGRYEARLKDRAGRIRTALVNVGLLPDRSALVVSLLDITDLKTTQKELEERTTFQELLLQTIPLGMDIVDQDGNVLFLSRNLAEKFGAGALGRKCWELYRDDGTQCDDCPLRRPIRVGETATLETSPVFGGRTFQIKHTGMLYQGRPAVLETFIDVTDRVTAEGERRLLATAMEQAQEGVFISDRDNRILYVNPAMERLYGYHSEQLLGRTPGIFKHEEQDHEVHHAIKEAIYNGRPWQGVVTNQRADGSPVEVAVTITPMLDPTGAINHFVSLHRDITAARQAERRLQQRQRLEALGTLAGGIAHDFNNLLTPIIGFAECGRSTLAPDHPLAHDLEQIITAGLRARDLVRQLLAVGRATPGSHQPLDPAPVVKEAVKLLAAGTPRHIVVESRVASGGHKVKGDATEIHQVVMNLCTNAIHAMEEDDHGTLTVVLEPAGDGGTPSHLRLGVRDTGCGIPDEVRERMFEPYFTTKDETKGTGLGLAVVHGIVQAMGGSISVTSEPGRGTDFTILLPVVASGVATTTPEAAGDHIRGRGEHLLLVDDDPLIVELGRRVLEERGWRVTGAESGKTALAVLAGDDPVDLLLTDLAMPGMDGLELIAAARKRLPALPVILTSGHLNQRHRQRARKLGIQRLVAKPTTPGELARHVAEVLAVAGDR